MKKTLLMLCILATISVVVEGGTGLWEINKKQHPVYETPEQLHEACKSLIKPPTPHMQYSDENLLFIVDYLDSKDKKMADAAADIISQLLKYRSPIRASAFKKYLSDEYPLDIRVVALASSIWMMRDIHDKNFNYNESKKEMKETWLKVINELAESPDNSKYFIVLAYAMHKEKESVELIKPENQPIMASKFLSAMSKEAENINKDALNPYFMVLGLVLRYFPAETTIKPLQDWYSTEMNVDVKAGVLDYIADMSSISYSDKGRLPKIRSLIESIAQDKEEKVAEKAKEILKKLNKQ